MTTIYAAYEGAVIWSDPNKVHKAGRVPLHEPLTVIQEMHQNWFVIERPENISLDPNPTYPDYWVYRTEIIEGLPVPDPIPTPDPTPDPLPEPDLESVSDEEAAGAILTLIKYYRQGLISVKFLEVSE